RFPDEVEGWIALGDRQFHDRGQLLLPAGGFRDAFRRAISLNPYYSEPYLHLLEDSFFRRDSADALHLAAEFARIDRGPRQCSMQLAVDLAWGSPLARRAATAALDTIPAISFWDCLPRFGTYPVTPEVREKIWTRVRDALGAVELPNWASPYFTFRLRGLAGGGQIAPIRGDLAGMERRSGNDSWWVERVQIMQHLSGFPELVMAHRVAILLLESQPHSSGSV